LEDDAHEAVRSGLDSLMPARPSRLPELVIESRAGLVERCAADLSQMSEHQSVHERVCFMCSSVTGTITQSW
jgi:hypothetical protein